MLDLPPPGEILRDGVFEGTDMTVTDFARRIAVSHVALSRVRHGSTAVSPDMALRPEGVLGTSAETWLALQADDDLWRAKKSAQKGRRIRIEQVTHQPVMPQAGAKAVTDESVTHVSGTDRHLCDRNTRESGGS